MCKVSILVPVFNQETYIKEALKSILNQSFKSFEIIIINDGSTDKTLEIIKSFKDKRIKIFSTKNKGIISALNYGIEKCTSNIIARFDGDDIMLSERLKIQYDTFIKKKPILLGSNAYIIDSNSILIGKSNLPIKKNNIRSNLLKLAPSFFHSSVMFNKERIKRLGGYNLNAQYVEDYDLWLSLYKEGVVLNIYKPLIKYRVHNESISKKNKYEAKLNSLISLKNHILNNCRLSDINYLKFKNEIQKNGFFLFVFKIDFILWKIKSKKEYFNLLDKIFVSPLILLRNFLMPFYKYLI